MPYTLVRLPKNTVQLDFTVPWENTLPLIERAAERLGTEMEVSGFRPGKVPTFQVIARLGILGILEKILDRLVIEQYTQALDKERLITVGNPHVNVTKLAQNLPVEFTAVVTLLPKITLPEYRTFSLERATQTISEQEVDDALHELARLRTEKGKEMPPIDDTFSQSVGKFKTLLDLKNQLKNSLLEEKKEREENRVENALVDQLIEKTIFDEIPDSLIESERKNIAADMRHNIEERGIKFENWLAEIKKTEEEFLDGLTALAEKRARAALIMREVASAEKIEVLDEELKNELNHLLLHDASESFQKKTRTPEFKRYLRTILTSRKTMHTLKELIIRKTDTETATPAP